MFRNAYYNKRTSTMHLWHTVKGERLHDEIPWVPYLYIPVAESPVKPSLKTCLLHAGSSVLMLIIKTIVIVTKKV